MVLPPIFDPIVNAPKPQKIVLGVLGLATIVAAAYFLVLSPLEIKVDQLRTQNESLQRELAQARRIAADLVRFRVGVAALDSKVKALRATLPTERGMPPC